MFTVFAVGHVSYYILLLVLSVISNSKQSFFFQFAAERLFKQLLRLLLYNITNIQSLYRSIALYGFVYLYRYSTLGLVITKFAENWCIDTLEPPDQEYQLHFRMRLLKHD